MSAREVRDRLADRFRLLKGPEPGPDGQQTLWHAVGWSYDLLADDERELLRITSVFAGGFDLASIYAVVDGLDEVDVLGHLDSLVRKSLVVAGHTTPSTRYRSSAKSTSRSITPITGESSRTLCGRDGAQPAPRAHEHAHRAVRGRDVQGGQEPGSHRSEGGRSRAVTYAGADVPGPDVREHPHGRVMWPVRRGAPGCGRVGASPGQVVPGVNWAYQESYQRSCQESYLCA